MGLRFRKSWNFGGFRINISKSGIGYSFGVKGMRLTKKAKGGFRSTASIPGTGISYVKDSHKISKRAKPSKPSSVHIDSEPENQEFEEIISNETEFVKSLNTVSNKNRLFKNIFILSIIGLSVGIALIASGIQNMVTGLIIVGSLFAVAGVVGILITPKNIKIKFELDFDNSDQFDLYNLYLKSLKQLSTSYELYLTSDGSVLTQEYVKTDPLNNILDSDIDVVCIYLKNCYLYFLPNMIIVYQNKTWKGVDYDKIKITTTNIEKTFYNSLSDLNDTEKLYTSYKYLNKDGSPDKRYTKENNPLIIVCAYAEIKLISETGFILNLVSSNRQKSNNFTLDAQKFFNSFN